MAAIEVVPKWRPVRRGARSLKVWLFWAGVFYVGLVISQVGGAFAWLALVLPIPIVLLVAMALHVARQLLGLGAMALSPVASRRWPATPVPPPPQGAAPDESFVHRPAVHYPLAALARRQCGWVALRLRIDAKGLVQSYQITGQAPDRQFGRALAQGLASAALAPGAPREASTLVSFVVPGQTSPDWALDRLQRAPS